ncbi:DUF4303 domain-containing protein [Corynebacterium mendelii]|uniref:DUF4303 domain-containing protein n=1 Tax=Corynebacterium mendelii TaxID=2765362 RepID=A0A939DYM4_9CORY|nr:DUF4303 domain-containing protein [Corynebacterium mendelii]MBN9643645.1 DUF4303 domain-containing protein [Corynebacterium mendelii]
MSSSSPSFEQTLTSALVEALEQSLHELFGTGEDFYWMALIDTGQGLRPFLCAWSTQAFQRYLASHGLGPDSCEPYLRWSYAESPYLNVGAHHFAGVDDILKRRPTSDQLDPDQWEQELDCRVECAIAAFKELDARGLFAAHQPRENIMINVEDIPPTEDNTTRARELNPAAAIGDWLEFCAE